VLDPFAGSDTTLIKPCTTKHFIQIIATYQVLIKILFKRTTLKELGWSCKIGYQWVPWAGFFRAPRFHARFFVRNLRAPATQSPWGTGTPPKYTPRIIVLTDYDEKIFS